MTKQTTTVVTGALRVNAVNFYFTSANIGNFFILILLRRAHAHNPREVMMQYDYWPDS